MPDPQRLPFELLAEANQQTRYSDWLGVVVEKLPQESPRLSSELGIGPSAVESASGPIVQSAKSRAPFHGRYGQAISIG